MLVVVMCHLVTYLQSARLKRANTHKLRISGPSDSSVPNGEKLLACVIGEKKHKIIIKEKDAPFWDYFYTKEDHYSLFRHGKSQSVKCIPYTPPPKPSSALRNLTAPALGDDMIGLVASFVDSALNCRPCRVVDFGLRFLDECNTPSIGGPPKEQRQEFQQVSNKVIEQGGTCSFQKLDVKDGHTLQSCMRLGSPFADMSHEYFEDMNRFASCDMQSESQTQAFLERKPQDHRWPLSIDQLALQKVIDKHRQDLVHIKHVFDGL